MKKSIVIVLVLLMLLSVAACGETGNKLSTTTTTEMNTTITTTHTTAQQTTTQSQRPESPVGKLADGVDKTLGQEVMRLIDTHYNLTMSHVFNGKISYGDVIDVNGKSYRPVTFEKIPDYQSLENTIKSTYDENTITYFLDYFCYGEPLYGELNGQFVMRWNPNFRGIWCSHYEWSEYTIEKIETDGDKGTVIFLVKYPKVYGSIATLVDNEGNKTPDDRRYNHERIEAPIVLCDGGWRLTSVEQFYGDGFLVEE